ncbi:unnamed protein product [Toxocara canis]|uniref:Secreted protein n=1 Tax=Toxocara canis TaxID=6265 RepID=A0A183V9Y1_TOXCA|nr:unnamed protein product [Toxocara canis]
MRALVIAIIFGQLNAYNSRQRTIRGIVDGVSSQLSDYGNEWIRSGDRQNFDDSIDEDDNIEEDHEIVATTISTLPVNRSRARKRSPASRLCGNKLVEAIVKMCNGCVKPAGGKPVSAKRFSNVCGLLRSVVLW